MVDRVGEILDAEGVRVAILDPGWNRTLLLALLGCLMGITFALAVVGPAQAGSVDCGDVVSADTTLQADLVNCPNNGLVIGADEITIDLNGHTIDGDDALTKSCGTKEICDVGVVSEGFDDVRVTGGGTMREFAVGALLVDAEAARFRDVAIRGNEFLGMVADHAVRTKLLGLRIHRNGLDTDQAGLGIFESREVLMAGSAISHNGDIGLLADRTAGLSVVRNRIVGHPEAGMLLAGNQGRITRNLLVRNADGIALGGNGNRIKRNRINRAKGCGDECGIGIQIEAGKGNVVAGNRVRHTAQLGISIAGFGPVSGVVVKHNTVRDAGKDGIAVRSVFEPVKRVRVRSNRAVGSRDDGIDVAIRSTKLARNVALRNGDHGIEAVDGVKDGGGNRARGNGNPEQCKGVACT
jgi:hypothetical protein